LDELFRGHVWLLSFYRQASKQVIMSVFANEYPGLILEVIHTQEVAGSSPAAPTI